MARSRLFGYSVDEEDGRMVITVDGVLAENCIRQIRESAETGKGGEMLAELLPVESLRKFMSGTRPKGAEEEALSLEQILGQNIDQSFSGFEQQIAELRESIAELRE